MTTVRRAALLLGLPALAAAVLVGRASGTTLVGRASGTTLVGRASGTTAAVGALLAEPAAHAKPAPRAKPTRHASPGLPALPPPPAKPERPTIAGKWYFANGILLFYLTTAKGGATYADRVISQRPSVFCPKVNDQDGQMVLHHKRHTRVYTGTWKWFYPSNCQFAGYGLVTITVWWNNNIAVFTSAPPKGLAGPASTFTLLRQR